MYEKTEHRDVNDWAMFGDHALLFVGALVGLAIIYWLLGMLAAQFYLAGVVMLGFATAIFKAVVTIIRILGKFNTDTANVQADVVSAVMKPADDNLKLVIEALKGYNQMNKDENALQAMLVKAFIAKGAFDSEDVDADYNVLPGQMGQSQIEEQPEAPKLRDVRR